MDFFELNLPKNDRESQQSSFQFPMTPDLSLTAASRTSSLQLDFGSQDLILRDIHGFSSESEMTNSVQRSVQRGRIAVTALNDEEGILLQPDFDFDEDGNLIELGGLNAAAEVGKRSSGWLDTDIPVTDEVKEGELDDISWDYQVQFTQDGLLFLLTISPQPMLADEDMQAITEHGQPNPIFNRDTSMPQAPEER